MGKRSGMGFPSGRVEVSFERKFLTVFGVEVRCCWRWGKATNETQRLS